jgi:hypothetical protein
MNMPAKLGLLAAAISPVPFTVLFIGSFIYLFKTIPPADFERVFLDYAVIANIIGLAASLFFTAVTVYFIAHVARNPNCKDRIPHWVILILITGPIGECIYWYHHIWRDGAARED